MSVLVDDGSSFIYHYDDPLDSQTYEHTAGRLAWVEEVTGTVQLGYDARGNEVRFHREINDTVAQVQLSAEEVRTFSPSGLLREVDFQDGLAIAIDYDDAGRPTSLGDLWELESYDPAGRILAETFGNDVTQSYDYSRAQRLSDSLCNALTARAMHEWTSRSKSTMRPRGSVRALCQWLLITHSAWSKVS